MTFYMENRGDAPYATATVSPGLIGNVRALYELGSREVLSRRVSRYGLNAYTGHALAAYVIAVAAVEAFVNEVFLVVDAEAVTRASSLWRLRRKWVERLDLRDKIVLITQLLLGHAMDPGTQPLQDMDLLLQLRHEVVHYKRGAPPKFVKEFIQRGIVLTSRRRREHPETALVQPWVWDLACTEGIRWAHNAACRTVHGIMERIPIEAAEYQRRGAHAIATVEEFRQLHNGGQHLAGSFREISEADARAFYQDLGLDLDA